MASTLQHIAEARLHVRGITHALDRMATLEGARNPEAMALAIRDACCAAHELHQNLGPLRARVNLQLRKAKEKKTASKESLSERVMREAKKLRDGKAAA